MTEGMNCIGKRLAKCAVCLLGTVLTISLLATPAWAADFPAFADNECVIVIDDQSGAVLYQQNQDTGAYPASTTKLTTALVALDYVSDKLDDRVTVGSEVKLTPAGSSVAELKEGDSFTWREMFYALLLPSGNDAALTIAVNVARMETGNPSLSDKDAIDEFARLMNEKAASLGCQHTHYVNPHGIHDEDHYTTASDLLLIAQEALKSDLIREVVKNSHYGCTSGEGTQMDWYNTNWLVDETCKKIDKDGILVDEGQGDVANPYYCAEATGVKTGSTDQAGRCLVFTGSNDGMSFLAIILHAADQPTLYAQASGTLKTVLGQFERHVWSDGQADVADIALDNPTLPDRLSGATQLAVTTEDACVTTVDTTQDITTKVVWDDSYLAGTADSGVRRLVTTVAKGTQVATLECYVAGELVGSYPLVATSSHTPWGTMDYVAVIAIGLIGVVVVVIIVSAIARGASRKRRRSAGRYDTTGYGDPGRNGSSHAQAHGSAYRAASNREAEPERNRQAQPSRSRQAKPTRRASDASSIETPTRQASAASGSQAAAKPRSRHMRQ